jgi:hypothetical protein
MKYSLIAASFLFGASCISAVNADSVEVLINGNLEQGGAPKDWSLTTSITELPGVSIPSLFEHNDGAALPMTPGLGLFFKPQAGNLNPFAGLNYHTNFTLEQTVAAVANRAYTFKGNTYWGGDGNAGTSDGYSGGTTLLHSGSPSDPTPEDPDDPPSVASPTDTRFEVSFLNAANSVLATHTLDLETVQMNDAMWREHSLVTPNSPVGTNKVRVRVVGEDLVDNFGFQDMYLDQFSLRDSVSPFLERLTSPDINSPGDPVGYVQSEGPVGNNATGGGTSAADSLAFVTSTINPNGNHTVGGAQGLWFRPFVNTTQFDPDLPTVFGILQQDVPVTPGKDYTFSAWTVWEKEYSGGFEGAGVDTLLTMQFLNGTTPIGSEMILDLYAAGMRNDTDGEDPVEPEDWQQFTMPTATAPPGATAVRVSVKGLDMFNSSANPQSAFFDDLSLIETDDDPAGLPGDFTNDGVVDAADYVMWRKLEGTSTPLANDGGLGTPIDGDHYSLWVNNFGETSPGSGGNGAVPEPASAALFAIALAMAASVLRRR